MKPRVSIVTPSYNRGHVLPRLWASLQRQTESRFQWIVIDDGSTDNTEAWVKGLADKRIIYRRQQNQGANAARNLGMKFITADYVTFIDSDDEFYARTSLAEMLAEITKAPKDIGIVAFTLVDIHGRDSFAKIAGRRQVVDYVGMACRQYPQYQAGTHYTSIIRTSISNIAPFPPYQGFEELRHLILARHTKTMLVFKPVQIYHISLGDAEADNMSAVRGFLGRVSDLRAARQKFIAQHKSTWLTHCPCIYANNYTQLALYQLLLGETATCLASLRQAVIYGNWRVRIKALLLGMALPLPRFLRRRLFMLAWRLRA